MKLKDTNCNFKLNGILKITREFKDGTTKVEVLENLVVTKAREVVRDLVMNGSGPTITKLVLGDSNVPPNKALMASEIGTPSLTDINLKNLTLRTSIKNKEALVYENRPSIKYSFTIGYEEGNGLGDKNYFTEAGLALDDDTLFTRLTFKALTKDNTSSLNIDYFLLF